MTSGTLVSPGRSGTKEALVSSPVGEPHTVRKVKAPPIDCFDGESSGVTFEDWLQTLKRVATWNHWTDEDCLVQLAGYLRKQALQEWNLLTKEERQTFASATDTLQNQLDPSSRVLAAQEFRHALQSDNEPVSEFIRRLEQLYRKAYGRDKMSGETRDTLLFGQLQEGLKYALMKAPAVSGAQGYKQLYLAARNEEQRLMELERGRQYPTSNATPLTTPTDPSLPLPTLPLPPARGTPPFCNQGQGTRWKTF